MLSLLAAESERAPVLVLVDDLQWVDRESAAALGFAARRLREDPVCFLWAARSGSIPPEFVQGMPVLTLAGLSRADALALVPDRVADGVVERLVDDTGGNPLGILEIAGRLTDAQRVGAAPLPDALPVGDRLGVVYEQQLTGLSAPAWRAVLLSALNRSGTSAPVAAALVREGVDVAAALDEAQDHGVLVRHGAEIGFRHPLLRTAVLARGDFGGTTVSPSRTGGRSRQRSTLARGDLAPSRSCRRPGRAARAGPGARSGSEPHPAGVRRRIRRDGAGCAARGRRCTGR